MDYKALKKYTDDHNTTLVAVSKTKPIEAIQELYNKGQRIFGENRVQELASKYEMLPKDIEWHMIGHLQKTKVKHMASFVSMIHSVDNKGLLTTVNNQATKHNRTIDVLLQIKIAEEESKTGWTFGELKDFILEDGLSDLPAVRLRGVMGMATFTDDKEQVNGEFARLKEYFNQLSILISDEHFDTISMGMSGDYELAIAQGSNMVRIGSLIFGARNYS